MALSILRLFKESVEFVIEGLLSKLCKTQVTGSAYCQARCKIKPELFRDLSQLTVACFESLELPRWKDYRILGCEGSTANLTASKQIRGHFGVESNSAGKTNRSLARIFLVYDVLSDLTITAQLGRTSTGESGLLDDCLDSGPRDPGDLLAWTYISDTSTGCQTSGRLKGLSASGCRLTGRVLPKVSWPIAEQDFVACWNPSS